MFASMVLNPDMALVMLNSEIDIFQSTLSLSNNFTNTRLWIGRQYKKEYTLVFKIQNIYL